jgi:predicted NUDIX family phosphoesterase
LPYLTLEGFVNFEGDAVGRVHLGVVYEAAFYGDASDFTPRDGVADLAFQRYNEIDHAACEPWSQMVLDGLLGVA